MSQQEFYETVQRQQEWEEQQMKTNTGGPAFPRMGERCQSINEDGMTLRDYFAAKAMQGLLASEVHAPLEDFAATAYKMADAMLKEREA